MDQESSPTLTVTWHRAVLVWWAFLWRLVILAAGPALLVASVCGGIVAFLLVPYLARYVMATFFVIGTAILSIPVVKWVLEVVVLDGFAVRLVSVEQEPPDQTGAAS